MRRGMHEMLDPVDRDRRFRARDIEDALHPQHLVAMAVKQHGQPDPEHRPIDRLIQAERDSADVVVAVAVAVHVGGAGGVTAP